VLQEAELSGQADSGRLLRDYVLHRTGCTQEDDQLLREGRGWLCAPGRQDQSSVTTLLSLRPQMDVRFCKDAGTLSREAHMHSNILIRPTPRSPERAKRYRAFLLTGDLHGCRSYVRKFRFDTISCHWRDLRRIKASRPRPSKYHHSVHPNPHDMIAVHAMTVAVCPPSPGPRIAPKANNENGRSTIIRIAKSRPVAPSANPCLETA
jgi:hypothetical protein